MEISYLFNIIEGLFLKWGYFLVFLSSFIETSPFGFLIPGGLIVAAGGYYSYSSNLSIAGVLLFGTLGMMTTLTISYYLGHQTGYSVVKLFKQEKNSLRAKKLLAKHGAPIITAALIANTTRFWMAYVSGIQKYKFVRFLLYNAIASLSWNSLLVSVGYLAGTERFKIEKGLTALGIFSYILVLLVTYLIIRTIKKASVDD